MYIILVQPPIPSQQIQKDMKLKDYATVY